MTKRFKKISMALLAAILSTGMILGATLSSFAAGVYGSLVDNSVFAWRIYVEYSFGTTGAAANHGTTLTYKVYMVGEQNSSDYHTFGANHIKINGWYSGQTEGAADTNLHYTRPTALTQYGGSGSNKTLIIAERSVVVPAIHGATTRNFAIKTTVTGEGSCNGSSSVTIAVPVTKAWYITYDANGGTGAPARGTKYNNVSYTVSSTVPTRTGYDFVNWKCTRTADGTATGNTYAPGATMGAGANNNYTLVAQWKKKTYAVKYNGNGSGATNVPAAQTKTYGDTLKLSSTKPTRSGYTFLRWNTKADGTGTNYNPGANYTANAALTLYAQWSLNQYTFSYDANGGIGAPASQTKTHGVDLVLRSEVPTRTGYKFKYWNIEPDGSGTYNYQPGPVGHSNANRDVTFYAQWEPITYKLVFHPNAPEASGTMPDQTFTYDTAQNVYANSFVNPGFKLVGWDTDPNASPSGTLLIRGDQSQVLNLTDEDGKVLDVYAIWRPIGESVVDISAGKILHGAGVTDEFTFRIEPVEGWKHENESTRESGQTIPASQMPLPDGTPAGQRYKDITINGFAGNPEVLRTSSFGLITFEDPGWYMYKVSEVIPSNPSDKVIYDKSSYYVVAYVEYKEEDGFKIKVSNTTAWHNSGASSHFRPNIQDISEITDNNNAEALENIEKQYGKVGLGTNGITVKFWNKDYPTNEDVPVETSFYVTKNVTGSLGDLTKQFEFTAQFSNLAPNTTYTVFNEEAVLGEGFSDGSIHTDANGNASVSFKLSDDAGFAVDELPVNAKFEVTEAQSDHFPSYVVSNDNGEVKSDQKALHGSLSTGTVTMSEPQAYTVNFTNSRDITENTGVLQYGIPIVGIVLVVLLVILFVIKAKRKEDKVKEE